MNICYLSSSALGKEMLSFLQLQNCNIIFSNTENDKIAFDDLDYDLGISFLYTHKIPASEFLKNKLWINFHPGPLPEYRGRNLCYHAIMNGAETFGATIHYMDKEFDTGDIIEVRIFKIEPHYTAGDLSNLSKEVLVELFKKYIPLFISGKLIPGKKQLPDGNYYKKTAINERITLEPDDQKRIRALTVSPHFYAHIMINDKKYLIIPEQDKANTYEY